ncbi:Spy/CpxP family protein refolding chaperone [Massilia sp. DJPM01]|uniref:Spy/CpxP family protein refolding chaperone n=1 Tax=Massilia sp. DJPM01 TaxID=3024404 RepID=UPI00259D3F13|nr:Spy/CpxP family protein refolding chaperone [Massilia sp. DJPM01]MDM5176262.1 Spy/CpxP family protein refolding chaperone [Massilia sp. DJPM01]
MNVLINVRNSLVIGFAVLGMGGAAVAVHAQESGHPKAASVERHHGERANWGAHMAARQARLHDQLKLSAAQEPAWAAFTAASKPGQRPARGERGQWASLTAPERMEKQLDMAKQHVAAMETRLAALNTFYAALTPEQKKVFDEHSMRRGHHGKHKRHA